MIFKQIRHEPLGQSSYLIGCARRGEAVVVDPSKEIGVDTYLLEAADLGLEITQVLETHVHADYVSCARDLAARSGAPVRLHTSASEVVTYDYEALQDGECITIGKVSIEARHTPGHTREHLSYLVTDSARTDRPWLVLTGDSLLVGDVGRPDLSIDGSADVHRRASLLYKGIAEKLMTLDDHVEVYPAHYGGSRCGGVNLSGKPSSTIGFERRHNVALQADSIDEFVKRVRVTLRPEPPRFAEIKRINAGAPVYEGRREAS